MDAYVRLPIQWLTFWYFQAPKGIVLFFLSLNKSFLQITSLPLMLRTFFEPWKNEYRKGLVGFSVFMGMFIKSIFILGSLVVFVPLLVVEFAIFLIFLLWPIATFSLLFAKI